MNWTKLKQQYPTRKEIFDRAYDIELTVKKINRSIKEAKSESVIADISQYIQDITGNIFFLSRQILFDSGGDPTVRKDIQNFLMHLDKLQDHAIDALKTKDLGPLTKYLSYIQAFLQSYVYFGYEFASRNDLPATEVLKISAGIMFQREEKTRLSNILRGGGEGGSDRRKGKSK